MAGRKPKPISLTVGEMNKEEKREREEAEQSLKGKDDEVSKPPKWLSKEGKKIYKFLVEQLKESNILCNLDIETVAICSDAMDKMHKANEVINKQGLIVEHINKVGALTYIENPAIKTYTKYQTIYQKCIAELGLSPSARAKMSLVQIQSKEKKDPLLEALKDDDDYEI